MDLSTDKNKYDLLPVIYIAGAGRSGSSILSRLIESGSDSFAAGELTYFWQRGVIEDQLCSCGTKFSKCEFWQEIIKNVYGKLRKKDAQAIEYTRKKSLSYLKTAIRSVNLYKNLTNTKLDKNSNYINNRLHELYSSVQKISAKKYIIDSTKYPSELTLLAYNKKIQLSLIHLTRDCPAVVYSWRKKVIRPEISTHKEYMPRYSALKTSIAWTLFNNFFEQFKDNKVIKDYVFTKYEDLCSNPTKELSNISDSISIAFNSNIITDLDTSQNIINLNSGHSLSGNPSRFRAGEIEIRLDQSWKRKIKPFDYTIANLISKKLRKKYDYI